MLPLSNIICICELSLRMRAVIIFALGVLLETLTLRKLIMQPDVIALRVSTAHHRGGKVTT